MSTGVFEFREKAHLIDSHVSKLAPELLLGFLEHAYCGQRRCSVAEALATRTVNSELPALKKYPLGVPDWIDGDRTAPAASKADR